MTRREGKRRQRLGPLTWTWTMTLNVRLVLALGAWGWGLGASASDPGAAGQDPKVLGPAPVVADFKLSIAFYGVRKDPITTAELVVRGGIAYYFASEVPEEILIIDPAAARLELFDL